MRRSRYFRAAECPMAFADYTGKSSSVGRYELIEELGEGGMGVVWRVLDPRTSGEVAIKIMKDISEYLRPHFQLEELNVPCGWLPNCRSRSKQPMAATQRI